MSQTLQEHQIALIGAGPIGIEIAVELKKAGLDYIHFDAGAVGQTIYAFPQQTRFFSSNQRIAIAGVPLQTPDQNKSTREQYLAYLRSVVQMFDLPVRTYERVESIQREGEVFLLQTRALHGVESKWRFKKLILATGGTAAPRRLGIAGEDQPHVHHQFVDPHLYFNRRVLIVGGRNSAVEAALRCHHVGAEVAISYRRGGFDSNHIKYWLYPEITGLIHADRIIGHFDTVPVHIDGRKVTLRHTRTGEETHVTADFVLCLIGYEADMALERMAGVTLEGDCRIPRINPQTMESNVPGVFVAGTATAGTQDQFRIFIENCHEHGRRIVAALTGRPVEAQEVKYLRPES